MSTDSFGSRQAIPKLFFFFQDAFAVLVLIPDSCTLIPSPRLDKISAIALKTFAASSSFFMFPSPFSVNSHIVLHVKSLTFFAIAVFLPLCVRLPEVFFLFRLTAHRTHTLHYDSSPDYFSPSSNFPTSSPQASHPCAVSLAKSSMRGISPKSSSINFLTHPGFRLCSLLSA